MRVNGLINALAAPASLKWRAIQTGLLEVLLMGVSVPLRLIGNLVLVQFLFPEAFGLMATITLLHMGLGLLSDVGLQESIIREKDGERADFLCIVWTVKVIRGAVLTTVTALIGVLLLIFQGTWIEADTIYADPLLPLLIIASSVSFLIGSLGSVNTHVARRRLQTVQLMKLQLTASVASTLTMVLLAVITGSVWSILVGIILSHIIGAVLSYLWIDGPPMRFIYDRVVMARLWKFGRWIIVSSVFGYLLRNTDRIIFSFSTSAGIFSLYAIAFNWIDAGRMLLQQLISRVVQPVIGELVRENRSDLRSKLEFLVSLQIAIVIVMIFALPAVVTLIFDAFFPDEYQGAIQYLSLIALSLIHAPMSVYSATVTVIGNSRLIAVTMIATSALTFISVWWALNEGGLKLAILAYATLPVVQSQALFLFGGLSKTIGWRVNLLWLACFTFLTYFHMVWFFG